MPLRVHQANLRWSGKRSDAEVCCPLEVRCGPRPAAGRGLGAAGIAARPRQQRWHGRPAAPGGGAAGTHGARAGAHGLEALAERLLQRGHLLAPSLLDRGEACLDGVGIGLAPQRLDG